MARPRLFMPDRRRAAFTLVELMIVLGIIVILAALGTGTLKQLMPRMRARHAAAAFAADVELARSLAVMHGRQTRLTITDYDTTLTNPSDNLGAWNLSVGNRKVNSSFWDILPYEGTSGVDVSGTEGTRDISEGHAQFKRFVSMREPDVLVLEFDAKGWLTNTDADISDTGYTSYTFVNLIALAEGLTEEFTVHVYRGGMVRIGNSANTEYGSMSSGYDAMSSAESNHPSGGSAE